MVQREISSWKNVKLVQMPLTELPAHMGDPGSYAFKPWVVRDALVRHPHVLWIDANAELRRPVDRLAEHIAVVGHFFVTHPYAFPNTQFHHPETVARFGCSALPATRQHCATTFIGIKRDGWAHQALVNPLAACALETDCINPVNSSRANHRQEQTVLNAIMCGIDAPPICLDDKRWRMTSDFENNDDPWQPTTDETDWNDMSLYTRRNDPLKQYTKRLKYKA
jgi:hypothetical protein